MKKINKFFLVVVMSLLLTGCGGEYREGNRTASEGAGRYTYCTDTNLYRFAGDETGSYILQSRLYYEVLMEKDDKNGVPMTAVYRVPIYQDGDGYDVAAEEEAELVVSGINTKAPVYVDDEYVLYTKANEGTFIKYDIEKKRKMPNEVKMKGADPGGCVRVGDTFVMRDYDSDRLYAQPKEALTWELVLGMTRRRGCMSGSFQKKSCTRRRRRRCL